MQPPVPPPRKEQQRRRSKMAMSACSSVWVRKGSTSDTDAPKVTEPGSPVSRPTRAAHNVSAQAYGPAASMPVCRVGRLKLFTDPFQGHHTKRMPRERSERQCSPECHASAGASGQPRGPTKRRRTTKENMSGFIEGPRKCFRQRHHWPFFWLFLSSVWGDVIAAAEGLGRRVQAQAESSITVIRVRCAGMGGGV